MNEEDHMRGAQWYPGAVLFCGITHEKVYSRTAYRVYHWPPYLSSNRQDGTPRAIAESFLSFLAGASDQPV